MICLRESSLVFAEDVFECMDLGASALGVFVLGEHEGRRFIYICDRLGDAAYNHPNGYVRDLASILYWDRPRSQRLSILAHWIAQGDPEARELLRFIVSTSTHDIKARVGVS